MLLLHFALQSIVVITNNMCYYLSYNFSKVKKQGKFILILKQIVQLEPTVSQKKITWK